MRRVLIVEDDRFISTIFKMFLIELGHDLVGRCETGSQAIELCRTLHPDVVLMDIHLQGEMDGIQAAEKLRMEFDLPVIYISGDTSNTIIERAIVSNSYGYLVKPVNKKELGISIDLAYFKHKVDVEQKRRERGYREFISESPVPIIIVRNGKIQYLNKLALEKIMKTTYIEDVMWLNFEKFVEEGYRDKVNKLIGGEGLEDSRFVDEYVVLKDLHGAIIYAEISGSTVRFNNELATQIIIRDVTPRVFQSEMAEFFKSLVLKSNQPLLILNKLFEIVDFNASAVELFPELAELRPGQEALFLKETLERDFQHCGMKKTFDVEFGSGSQTIFLTGTAFCLGGGTVAFWMVTRQ